MTSYNVLAATLLVFQHNFLFLLLRSRLSNITSYYVLVATLWGFQHSFQLRFCCEALGFPPQTRPIMFVAAMLLTFSNYFLLRSLCYALGLSRELPVYCCYALDFQSLLPNTFLLLRSWLSNITSRLLLLRSWLSIITSYYFLAANLLAFHHNFRRVSAATLLAFQTNLPTSMLVIATLLTFNHYFLLRACCYALGFPT